MDGDQGVPREIAPPVVFVDEGGGIGPFFESVDDLIEYLEWPDQFDGDPVEAFDSHGWRLMIAVDSGGRPAISVSDSPDRAALESRLRSIVRDRPVRYGLLDADVDLNVLLRALWPDMRWGKGGYPGRSYRFDDPLDSWRRQELVWSLRWLAAEPEAAIGAVPDVVTADEIALDIEHGLEVARDSGLLDDPALSLIIEIDRQFDAMSEPGNGEMWTDQAIATSSEWAAQRERARAALTALGESRADADLGTPRPGGPTYVTGARENMPSERGDLPEQ
jgi:hypothetical protein